MRTSRENSARNWLCIGREHLFEVVRSWSQSVTRKLDDGKQKNPIRSLDGVRAVACLSVIGFHINLWSLAGGIWSPATDTLGATVNTLELSGEMGVILFFVLSGFLLFLPFARSMLFESDWPSPGRFYARRIFRILPGYYVAFWLMTLYLAPEYFQRDHWQQLWLFITMQMDAPLTYQQINAPFWTLAIEFQFYLLLPLIAWVMRRIVRGGTVKGRLLKITLCLVGMFVWGIATRYWGVILINTPKMDFLLPRALSDALEPYVYGSRGKFYDAFAVGMLICAVSTYVQNTQQKHVVNPLRRLSPWLFVLGLLVLVTTNIWHFYAIYVANKAFHFLDPYQPFLLQGYKDVLMPPLFALGYGLCLFAIVLGPGYLKRPFEWGPLRWIGLISYSLYLWHDPFVLFFLSSLLPKFKALGWSQTGQYIAYVFWVVVTVLPLSVALYRWLELPGIHLGEYLCHQFRQRAHQESELVAVTTQSQKPLRLDEESVVANER